MKLQEITKLKDLRTNCYSVLVEMNIQDYLDLIDKSYNNKGGIKGQREPLKSSSAIRIRKRMVSDIIEGTVLPPIVLGLIVSDDIFARTPQMNNEELLAELKNVEEGNLNIIDGMQRSTALIEAIENGANREQLIRVEFWISVQLNSLIYRMLVLNTGQVPWNLRRQIETVFSSMINEISIKVPELESYTINDQSRRTKGGQYHANDLIELYLAFGGRKEKVDTKERLADEFTRLDFIEVTENSNFADIYYESLKRLTLFDIEISRYHSENKEFRFNNGLDLFNSQPARVGFITAIAKSIFGRPGIEKSKAEIEESKNRVFKNIDGITQNLKKLDNIQLENFLSFRMLSEKLSVKSSRVGDFEREFFTKSFETLLEIGIEIISMEVCWLSY